MLARSLMPWLLFGVAACTGGGPADPAPVSKPGAPAPLAETVRRKPHPVAFGISFDGADGRLADFLFGVEAAFSAHAAAHPEQRRCELFTLHDRGRASSLADNLAFLRERERVDFLLESDLPGCRRLWYSPEWRRLPGQDLSMPWLEGVHADLGQELAFAIDGVVAAGVPADGIGLCVEGSGYGEEALRAGLACLAARKVDAVQVRRSRIDPVQPEPQRCLLELRDRRGLPRVVLVAARTLSLLALLDALDLEDAPVVIATSAVSPEELVGRVPAGTRVGVTTSVMPTAGAAVAQWLPDAAKVRPVTAAMREGFLAGQLLARAVGNAAAGGPEAVGESLRAVAGTLSAEAGFLDRATGRPGVWLQLAADDGVRRGGFAELVTRERR